MHTRAKKKNMSYRRAKTFLNDPAFSDTIVRIVLKKAELEAEEGRGGGTPTEEEQPTILKEVFASSTVLALSSEKFEAQVRRWTADNADSQTQKKMILEVVVDREEDVDVVETCLRFAYTRTLVVRVPLLPRKRLHDDDGNETVSEDGDDFVYGDDAIAPLIDVFKMACYLAQDECREATELQLRHLKSHLSIDDALCLMSQSPSMDMDIVAPALLREFGNVIHVMKSPELVRKLATVPPAGLVEILSSDQLKTDSEDSVLAMAWIYCTRHAEKLTSKQVRDILERVHLAALTDTYFHHVFPTSSLAEAMTRAEYGLLSSVRLASAISDVDATKDSNSKAAQILDLAKDAQLPSAWRNAAFRRVLHSEPLSFSVSRAEVVDAVKDLTEDVKLLDMASLLGRQQEQYTQFGRGYYWSLEMDGSKPKRSLSIFVRAHAPAEPAAPNASDVLAWNLVCNVTLPINKRRSVDDGKFTINRSGDVRHVNGAWGLQNVLTFVDGRCITQPADWDAAVMRDGAFTISVELLPPPPPPSAARA